MSGLDIYELIFEPKVYIETFLSIVDKSGRLVPFIFNDIQIKYYDYLKEMYWKPFKCADGSVKYRFQGIREVICKARQFGLSTFIRAIFFHDCVTNEGINSYIYCQDFDFSKTMMTKDKLFLKEIDEEFRPLMSYDTTSLVTFPGLMSKIQAGKPGVGINVAKKQGRSVTIQDLHISEFAMFPNPKATFDGLMEAVPPDGNVFIESSPNKIGDSFHNMYKQGQIKRNVWNSVFFPWYEFSAYHIKLKEKALIELEASLSEDEVKAIKKYDLSLEQIEWRRRKLSEKQGDVIAFNREYPENDVECFEAETTLIFPVEVRKATGLVREAIPGHIHTIGVDVGGKGKYADDSSICVIDAITNEQVYHDHLVINPEELPTVVYEIWLKYPGLVAIESNNDVGFAAIKAAELITDWYGFLFSNNTTRGGYYTGAQKRGEIFRIRQELKAHANGFPGLTISSEQIVLEMNWYQELDSGKMGSPPRTHANGEGEKMTDDSIMSLMIANAVKPFIEQVADIFFERFVEPLLADDPDMEIPDLLKEYRGRII